MLLPPNVSEGSFRQALQEFARVVGDQWVLFKDEDVAPYRDAYSPFIMEPEKQLHASAAVVPTTTEQVQQIVRIANKYRIPLYSISTGRNLGYGGSSPNLSGSVIVDLAAERGGNCDLTVPDEKIVTENGVTIVGYTDFPSRMAAQASTLYSNNIRHMLTDLTPKKDGVINHNMEDDVIRGATVTKAHEITFPPPPPKIAAIAVQKPKEKAKELTPVEKRAREVAAFKAETRNQVGLLVIGGGLILLAGLFAPASFMSHFIVFVLSCFVGFSVIWNVSHSLHTPLMAVTNAISSIIILGALMQIGSGNWLIVLLAALSVFMAGINIFGGFMVTRRMLAMFQKS